MLELREIEQEIAELEHKRNHSASDCVCLAALYSIRDHHKDNVDYEPARMQIPIYSQAAYSMDEQPVISAKVEISGNSEFLRSVAGKDTTAAWEIMDELMDNLKLVNPRVHDSVIRKIQAL